MKRHIIAILILAASLVILTSSGKKPVYQYPFQNPDLSTEQRVENLISLLTPEEKVGLLMNKSVSVDRLGIPSYNWWSEGCHGIVADGYTVFPQPIGMAAAFDPAMIYEVYSSVSDEARANWNRSDHNIFGVGMGAKYYPANPELSFWCPNVNIFRDPRWGRGQETSGEDPYLTSVIGVQTVKGMQGNDSKYFKTHACAKHYAVHSGPEPLRHRYDARVSMRDLWETYLPAFKALVTEGNVQEVMCAYNRYEGVPCCTNERLLQDILRNKWGYKSLVVTDCDAINNFYTKGQHETHPDAVHASADAVRTGADLECGNSYISLVGGIKNGIIKESDLDTPLHRVLESRFELGMFDPADRLPWSKLGPDVISSEGHDALARKIAAESIVLLKNDNHTLPLSKSIKKLAVVGPNADNVAMLNGNYGGTPTKAHASSILAGTKAAVAGAEIIYDKGCELTDEYNTIKHNGDFNGGKGLLVEFFGGRKLDGKPVSQKYFTDDIRFSTFGGYGFSEGVDAADVAVKMTGKFVPDFTGNLKYSISSDNGYTLIVNGNTVETSQPSANRFGGMRGAVNYKDIPVTAGQEYNIEVDYVRGTGPFAMFSAQFCERNLASFDKLAAKVKDADAIIIVGGITSQQEGEGGDRENIEFPASQQMLVKAMHATGKPVILVNCSGSAMAFTQIADQFNALIQAWYPGQAGALALADILFGDCNPSAKLPVTFYASTSQLPDFLDYSMNGRTYRYFTGKPEFPFGFGLSYTTFAFGNGKLSKRPVNTSSITVPEAQAPARKSSSVSAKVAAAPAVVEFTVPVTNTGSVEGTEVVQVYVKSLDNPEAPIKALKGFKRVKLAPGMTQSVKVALTADAFSFYNAAVDGVAVRAGKYQILYGSSSADSDLKTVNFQVL